MNPDAVDRIVAYRLGIRQVRNLIVFFCVCVILCEDLITMMCCYKVLINLHEFQNIFFYIKDNITLPRTVPNYLQTFEINLCIFHYDRRHIKVSFLKSFIITCSIEITWYNFWERNLFKMFSHLPILHNSLSCFLS